MNSTKVEKLYQEYKTLKSHAEALAKALREVVRALPPRYEHTIALGMMAISDWEKAKQ